MVNYTAHQMYRMIGYFDCPLKFRIIIGAAGLNGNCMGCRSNISISLVVHRKTSFSSALRITFGLNWAPRMPKCKICQNRIL